MNGWKSIESCPNGVFVMVKRRSPCGPLKGQEEVLTAKRVNGGRAWQTPQGNTLVGEHKPNGWRPLPLTETGKPVRFLRRDGSSPLFCEPYVKWISEEVKDIPFLVPQGEGRGGPSSVRIVWFREAVLVGELFDFRLFVEAPDHE